MTGSGAQDARESIGSVRILALVALCLLVHVGALERAFVLDDYDHLIEASTPLGGESYLLGGRPPLDKGSDLPAFAYIIRPLLHLSLALDLALFGADPRAFHAVQLALHLITVLLLVALLRRLGCAPTPAWFAGLVFAVHPVKYEAVIWISARGDVLVGIFGLLAAHALVTWRFSRRPWALVGCLLMTGAAIASKETGVLVAVLLVLLDVMVLRGTWRSRLVHGALQVACVAAYVAFRWWRLGDDMFYYGGKANALTAGSIDRMADAILPTLRGLGAGVFFDDVADDPRVTAGAILAAAIVVLGLLRATPAGRRPIASGLVLLAACLPFNLRFLGDAAAVDVARDFYLAAIPLAVALGGAAAALAAPERGRLPASLLLAGYAACLAWSFDHAASRHHDASRVAARAVASAERLVSYLPPGTRVFVEGVPADVGGAPAIGHFLEKALRPPLRGEPLAVTPVPGIDTFISAGGHLAWEGPLLFASWDAADRDIVPVTRVLEAAAAPQPRPFPPQGELRVDVPTRAVPSLTFVLDAPHAGRALDVEITLDDGGHMSASLTADARFGPTDERTWVLANEPRFVRAHRLRDISVRGDLRPRGVMFDRSFQVLEWRSPPPAAEISVGDGAPEVRFDGGEGLGLYRVELRAGRGHIAWAFTASPVDGVITWRPGEGHADVAGQVSLPWAAIAGPLRTRLDQEGRAWLDALLVVRGYRGDVTHPVAFSRPLHVRLVP